MKKPFYKTTLTWRHERHENFRAGMSGMLKFSVLLKMSFFHAIHAIHAINLEYNGILGGGIYSPSPRKGQNLMRLQDHELIECRLGLLPRWLAVEDREGLICLQCDEQFKTPKQTGTIPKFCSGRCKSRYHRIRLTDTATEGKSLHKSEVQNDQLT